MPPYTLTPQDQAHLVQGSLRVLDRVLAECDALTATPDGPALSMA